MVSFQAGYSRRIYRPRLWSYFENEANIDVGNDYSAATINNFEFDQKVLGVYGSYFAGVGVFSF